MRVFELGDATLLDVDASQAASLRDRFDHVDLQRGRPGGRRQRRGSGRSGSTGRGRARRRRARHSVADADALGAMALDQNRRVDRYGRHRGAPTSASPASICSSGGAGRRDGRRACAARRRCRRRRRRGGGADRGGPAPLRRRHGRGHDPARGGHRGPRDQPDQGLLRRPGDHHPHAPPRPAAGSRSAWSA